MFSFSEQVALLWARCHAEQYRDAARFGTDVARVACEYRAVAPDAAPAAPLPDWELTAQMRDWLRAPLRSVEGAVSPSDLEPFAPRVAVVVTDAADGSPRTTVAVRSGREADLQDVTRVAMAMSSVHGLPRSRSACTADDLAAHPQGQASDAGVTR